MLKAANGPMALSLVAGVVGPPEARLSAPAVEEPIDAEDYTRPILLGYVHRGLILTDGQMETAKQELVAFAQTEGFSMGFTYVEQPGTWPAAFAALIDAVNRYGVTAVVLPSLLHFAVFGVPTNIRDAFERATGARVLAARREP